MGTLKRPVTGHITRRQVDFLALYAATRKGNIREKRTPGSVVSEILSAAIDKLMVERPDLVAALDGGEDHGPVA